MISAIRSAIAAIAAAISVSGGTAPAAVSAAQPPAILKLNSVACASPAYCLAVGQDVTDQRGFAEEWNGSAWRMIPAPDPGTPAALWDVACYTAGRCLTVGTYFNAAGVGVTLACGTGACATAVAAIRRGLTGRKVDLVLDGGTLQIEWRAEDSHVLMTGPTAMPFRGRVDLDRL